MIASDGREPAPTSSPFWRNVTAEMGRLIDLGVDGLITDYPDRGAQILAAKGLKAR